MDKRRLDWDSRFFKQKKLYVLCLSNEINQGSVSDICGFYRKRARKIGDTQFRGSVHTINDKPWKLTASLEFDTKYNALQFEQYLKSGSGRAFAKKKLY